MVELFGVDVFILLLDLVLLLEERRLLPEVWDVHKRVQSLHGGLVCTAVTAANTPQCSTQWVVPTLLLPLGLP